jgi:hypothetical protein
VSTDDKPSRSRKPTAKSAQKAGGGHTDAEDRLSQRQTRPSSRNAECAGGEGVGSDHDMDADDYDEVGEDDEWRPEHDMGQRTRGEEDGSDREYDPRPGHAHNPIKLRPLLSEAELKEIDSSTSVKPALKALPAISFRGSVLSEWKNSYSG